MRRQDSNIKESDSSAEVLGLITVRDTGWGITFRYLKWKISGNFKSKLFMSPTNSKGLEEGQEPSGGIRFYLPPLNELRFHGHRRTVIAFFPRQYFSISL